MFSTQLKSAFTASLLFLALLSSACGVSESVTSGPAQPAVTGHAEADTSEQAIRFLEERVKKDKEDFLALNKLASYYLQRLRETGNVTYLELSARAAKSSLEVVPKEQNLGGLAALAQVEFASHNFVAARDYARDLIRLDPAQGNASLLLVDSLLELGDYEQAANLLKSLQRQREGAGVETRLARWALLRGDAEEARRRLTSAVVFAQNQRVPSRETIAWLHWQVGEVCFSVGEYDEAEKAYADALSNFPEYYRALASLGRVRAALGDRQGAIGYYERAVRIIPEPGFLSALGDLYHLTGREKDAATQYELIEQIGVLRATDGSLYNRQVAIFLADHDRRVEDAYEQAKREYASRRDIYGADTLAWTALKAGDIARAEAASKDALRLGTRDAKIFFHAGVIARSAGDLDGARDYLQRALEVNPQFDPQQAQIARQILTDLTR